MAPATLAIPFGNYQKNLERAITALDTLQQTDESESTADYEKRLDKTFASVLEALPEHQPVEASDEECNVDNSWLHAALNDIKSAPAEKRTEKITNLIERLQALEERVGYERAPGRPEQDKAYTKRRLESILTRPEYASEARGPNALSRLIADFIIWLQQFLPKPVRVQAGRSGWLTYVAQALVIGIALAVLFYVARILFKKFNRTRKPRAARKREARIVLGERLEPEDTAHDLLSEAEALARRGDLRAAIRKAYIALLVELGERKLITLAQYKTNRDYLNSVRSIAPLHSSMRALTDSFELHWYGFADATENDWQDFRARYHAALQTQS